MKPTARAKTLLKLVQRHGWRHGAELGVYEGATSDYLLWNVPDLQMTGVDVWLPIEGGQKDKQTGFSPKDFNTIQRARRAAKDVAYVHKRRFHIMETTTLDAARRFERCGSPFDFVFVDASHMTDAVVADVRAWAPLVRPGGAILGHDADWPSVQRALAILGFNPEYLPGNVWLQFK